jgi:hypothetical protein
MIIRDTIEYKEFGFNVVKCPVCGEETLDSHFICPHCEWEYDGTLDENVVSISNQSTIKEFRESFLKK